MVNNIAIVVFCYNRPQHLNNTLNSLLKCNLVNDFSFLFFCDGPKSNKETDFDLTDKVKTIANEFSITNKIVFSSDVNKGLAESVITGLDKVFEQYEMAIVLEDDLEFSTDFLTHIQKALVFYKEHKSVFSVSGYSFPIGFKDENDCGYFSYRFSSWAWATWKDRWKQVDWELKKYKRNFSDDSIGSFSICGEDYPYMLKNQFKGKIDSWAIRFAFNAFINKGIHYFPNFSKAANTGLDNSGTHSKKNNKLAVELVADLNLNFPTSIIVKEKVKELNRFYFKRTLIKKIVRFVRDFFNI